MFCFSNHISICIMYKLYEDRTVWITMHRPLHVAYNYAFLIPPIQCNGVVLWTLCHQTSAYGYIMCAYSNHRAYYSYFYCMKIINYKSMIHHYLSMYVAYHNDISCIYEDIMDHLLEKYFHFISRYARMCSIKLLTLFC